MFQNLKRRLSGSNGAFVKSSMLLAVGFALARVLGLMFSLLLGRALPTGDYGFIQYSVLLSGVIAIGSQPFMQHTFARFISTHRQDENALTEVFSTVGAMLVGIVVITLVIIGVIAMAGGGFNAGATLIFVCITLYYSYYGLARGFEDSTRLTIVFVGSNFIQFVAIFVAYYLLNVSDTFPALAIYGLSYIAPIAYLTFFRPLPVRFDASKISRKTAVELARFSLPVWMSQAMYALTASGDVFILSSMKGEQAAGAFVFTRTLGLAFDFLPVAIYTLIMPRVASSAASPRRILMLSIGIILATSFVMGIAFMLLYPWFITTFIQPEYLLPPLTVLVVILAQVALGLHGVVTGVIVGQNRPGIETVGRLVIMLSLYGACYALIPSQGILGAALANLIAGCAGLLAYPPLIYLWKRRAQRASASVIPSVG